MKRKGRQHGMVRTYRILPAPLNSGPCSKFANQFDYVPTAGLFTKVQSKPTNHSKFTSKCGKSKCHECHMHPSCKAKHKTKGSYKLKSNDVVTNHRLTTWRVVDEQHDLNSSGFSTSMEYIEDYDYDYDHDLDDNMHDSHENDDSHDAFDQSDDKLTLGPQFSFNQEIEEEFDIKNHDTYHENDDYDSKKDDDNISFCEVGIILDQIEGDEDWLIVEEV